MRRNLMLSGLGALSVLSGAVLARSFSSPAIEVSLGGHSIRRWGCQYQGIKLDEIARSDLDLIVLDPTVEGRRLFVDAEPSLRLKPNGGRRLVLAYLSVGEAESYRPYWNAAWPEQPPDWLGPENPRWPGSFSVRYWHPGWQDLLLGPEGAVDRIIEAGFDGVFLDRVDAYGDWASRGQDAKRTMIELVRRVSERLRSGEKKCLVVSQNAELLLTNANFRDSIDAVSKESLLYNLHGPSEPNTPDDIAWSLGYLEKAQAAGKPILAIEYLDDPALIREARRRFSKLGYLPFFGKRLLDEVPKS